MLAYIGALAAAVAVVVAFLQWMTAQTKLALDIHATRYAIYQDLRAAISGFFESVEFTSELRTKYDEAQSRARFHFGAEVERYLEEIRRAMVDGHLFDRYGHGASDVKVDEQIERLNRINAFYAEIDRMFIPYMRLDQRMPLWWWTPLKAKIRRGVN